MSIKVFCFSENAASLRVLVELANKISGVEGVYAAAPKTVADSVSHGLKAATLYSLEPDSPSSMVSRRYADTLHELVRRVDASLILVGATKFGKEVCGVLGALLDAPVSTDCREVKVGEGFVEVTRTVYSGNGVATETLSRLPAVVSVQTGGETVSVNSGAPSVEAVTLAEGDANVVVLDVRPKQGGKVKLEEAQRIVAVGRGLQKKEDLAIAEELASTLNAALGCTRPIAADLGWLGDDQWIGLSGHKVKPKLYVAVGISGQVQHIAGMRESGVVVSVNKDPNAPIVQNSDYAIVGDLYQVVPELVKALKSA
ncbi:MAG: electron transfer flavoprotein subunit alpha/FixB family protein [Thermoprotei archaeon]